jgi:hypothetical protein
MEMALRRRLDGVVSVSISQQRQHAEVAFAPGAPAFAPSEFRAAAAEAEVDVVAFEIDACGRAERDGTSEWLLTSGTRFAVAPGALPGDRSVCIRAALRDAPLPYRLESIRPVETGIP